MFRLVSHRTTGGIVAGMAIAVLLPAAVALTGHAGAEATTTTAAPHLAAGVVFENPGTITGWDPNPKPQQKGVIKTVASPAYKGDTAIMAQQTYVASNGKRYHSEVVRSHAQSVGQDYYYGQALYLPSDWVFTSQPTCFQQWAPENPGGPWLLMVLNGSELQWLGNGSGYNDIASVANLRGTWIRVVTHLKLAHSGGVLEVWVNGTKVVSKTGNWAPSQDGSTIRWSTGLYATYWNKQAPKGPHVITLYHDNLRIATSYPLAEPANWG
jgi:hypothetical protein